jgi:hypothetical protein
MSAHNKEGVLQAVNDRFPRQKHGRGRPWLSSATIFDTTLNFWTSLIRTSQRPANTLPSMCRRRDRWSLMSVVTDRAMSYGLHRLALAKTDWPNYLSEYCWPWSYCISIVNRLGIINQAINVGTSSYLDISLIWYGSNRPVEVAL